MPSSVIIVALVVAWLLVLVPIIARRRQEVAKTADSALAARIVHSGARATVEEESTMADNGEANTVHDDRAMADQHRDHGLSVDLDGVDLDGVDLDGVDEELAEDFAEELARVDRDHAARDHGSPDHIEINGVDETEGDPVEEPPAELTDVEPDVNDIDDLDEQHLDDARHAGQDDEEEPPTPRPYRPGRGGFDPEAAAVTARARYATRQRAVVIMLILAVLTAVAAGFVLPVLWWGHAAVDVALVSYLTYLRRQVRIENQIRQRRMARIAAARRSGMSAEDADHRAGDDADGVEDTEAQPSPARPPVRSAASTIARTRPVPGTVVVDLDDEDPAFDELDGPASLPYRRAVGE